jgi:hypothetical protein
MYLNHVSAQQAQQEQEQRSHDLYSVASAAATAAALAAQQAALYGGAGGDLLTVHPRNGTATADEQ